MATDYPVLRQDRFLKRVLKLGLPDGVLDAILWQNASRVFGLNLEGVCE